MIHDGETWNACRYSERKFIGILISNTKEGIGSVALTSRRRYLLCENI
jgi:hypothetical protein